MMFMSSKNEESFAPPSSRRSLASSFVISMEDCESESLTNFKWTLSPIDQIRVLVDDEISGGVGSQAIEAMHTHSDLISSEINVNGAFQLKCTINESRVIVEVDAKHIDAINENDHANALELAAILSRVMVQSALKSCSEHDSVTMTVPGANDPAETCTETYPVAQLLSSSGYAPLFAAVLPPDIDLDNIEMSDLVDSSGRPIGYVPRSLVHKFNLLHRGIGIVVCRDAHITKQGQDQDQDQCLPDIYVHQRTDTKRIFPSLWDMFVGGVSTAGEDLRLTAQREVGEELGLTRPSSLSDLLFQCIICTSYNRCVVTVFTYKYDSTVDEIKWQAEEVQWGDFVPYGIVENSGARSIGRLAGKWPGRESDVMEALSNIDDTSIERHEDSWDYVPDGLLVWIAWLKWIAT